MSLDWLDTIPLIGRIWRGIKRLWRSWIMAEPVFLSPSQGIDFRYQPTLSWLHLSVRLRGGWGQKSIEGCRVQLIRNWGEDPPGDGINMRWRHGDMPNGVEEITLRTGNTYSVPIAWRDDAEDGTTYITNTSWMQSNGTDKKWPLKPGRDPSVNHPSGRYEFWLQVTGPGGPWRSRHRYAIHVPPANVGNSYFWVEPLYSDLDA